MMLIDATSKKTIEKSVNKVKRYNFQPMQSTWHFSMEVSYLNLKPAFKAPKHTQV